MSRWNFIAQRATTREFLHWDLPIELNSLEWELSGPGALTGTLAPDVGGLRDPSGKLVLEEWGTIIYAESGGQIRWAGIVISCSFQGDAWSLECAGLSTYPHAITYRDVYSAVGVDPAAAFRNIWAHVQSFPDSDLGVAVVGDDTPVRLGTPAVDEDEAAPYELLWWEAPNCGEELDRLAQEAPFDWIEEHRWSDDREDVLHEIRIGYPRVGKRSDLLFEQGANVTSVVTVESNGDDFANSIVGLGAGEGQAMMRREIAIRDGRLRRDYVYVDKAISDTARLDSVISAELSARKSALRVSSFDVIDHENAVIGSWQLGDDVLLRFNVPWLGEVSMWVRITAWSLTGEHTATLTVTRSDLFSYGG